MKHHSGEVSYYSLFSFRIMKKDTVVGKHHLKEDFSFYQKFGKSQVEKTDNQSSLITPCYYSQILLYLPECSDNSGYLFGNISS